MNRHDFFSFIILLGVIQGIFLSLFFLIRKKENQSASLFLGLMIFFFALHNFDFWAGYTYFTLKHPHLLDVSVPLSFTMGPLIYQYVSGFFSGKTSKNSYWHYMPAALYLAYSMFFFLQSGEFKYNIFIQSRGLDIPLQDTIRNFSPDPWQIRGFTGILITLQLLAYLGASIFTYFRNVPGGSGQSAILSSYGVRWLGQMLIAASVIIVISSVIQLFFSGGKDEFVLATCFTLFIYFISSQLLGNTGFFKQVLLKEKYIKSSLDDNLKNDLIEKIEHFLHNEKPYLNSLFSLKMFARAVGASPNHLSQVLNEHYRKTYFEFISGLRISEACRLLSDRDNNQVNIEQIAYRVGYNSKSAFNRAFKIQTGQTPLLFKKNSNS
jgi:AraC-like DNA-binding protein